MTNNLFGICIVKNEADIIGFSLSHAARFCSAIFVLDNGSSDDTWERVISLSDTNKKIVPFERKICRYGVGLRGYIYNRVCRQFKPGDWILILDSDEFLENNPEADIEYCKTNDYDMMFTLQAQFYITRQDFSKQWYQNGHESIDSFDVLPAYYQINWSEPRLFKYNPFLIWDDLDAQGNPTQISYPKGLGKRSPKKIVNRHYQYRSLPQMKQRLALRSRIHKETGRFKHNQDQNFKHYIRDHRRLKQWVAGVDIKPTPLDFFRLYLIRRSKRFKRIIGNRTLEKR